MEIRQFIREHCNDIVMTVPFDEKTLTWKTNSTGQTKSLFNITSNKHRIQSKEVQYNHLHQAAGYPVRKMWLQAIKDGFFTS